MKSKAYFTRKITPEAIVEAYSKLGIELPGKVAVKVHSGETGNQNFLKPEFMKPMVEYVNGTIVENNTAYAGERTNTKDHLKYFKRSFKNVFTLIKSLFSLISQNAVVRLQTLFLVHPV